MVYRVKNWDKHFENNRSRALKILSWVPIPNKMDGYGYTRFISRENPAELLGTWVAIVEIASKCEPRGTLIRGSGKPHNSESLSLISRIPKEAFDTTIPVLLEIEWLEQVDDNAEVVQTQQESAKIPQGGAESQQGGAVKGRERNRSEGTRQKTRVPVIGRAKSTVDKPKKKDCEKQKKVVDMNALDMLGYFQNRHLEYGKDTQPKGKSAALLKVLITDIGAERVHKMVSYLFDNWKAFQKKYKIKSGSPTVGILSGFATSIEDDIAGRGAYDPNKRGSSDFVGDPLD